MIRLTILDVFFFTIGKGGKGMIPNKLFVIQGGGDTKLIVSIGGEMIPVIVGEGDTKPMLSLQINKRGNMVNTSYSL